MVFLPKPEPDLTRCRFQFGKPGPQPGLKKTDPKPTPRMGAPGRGILPSLFSSPLKWTFFPILTFILFYTSVFVSIGIGSSSMEPTVEQLLDHVEAMLVTLHVNQGQILEEFEKMLATICSWVDKVYRVKSRYCITTQCPDRPQTRLST